MRAAKVYFRDTLAGRLLDLDDHFSFAYDPNYHGFPISLSMPVREEPYVSTALHPFFDGLIVEGWLLKEAEKNWKLDPNDRFALLMLIGKDTNGAVSVIKESDDE